MKAMVCEMCGSNDVVKVDGVYVCQYCGTKYNAEEGQRLMVEMSGPMSVEGVATVDNLMDRAQEFLDRGDRTRALEYVDRVLDIDIHNERAREMQRRLEENELQTAIVLNSEGPTHLIGDTTVSDSKYQEIVSELRNGRKVNAIKLVREQTGWGLKEAKEYTENVLAPEVSPAPQMMSSNANSSIVRADKPTSEKSKTVTLLLCIFLGYFGAHYFYVGKYLKGVLYFFTMGIFMLGWLWDIVRVLSGKFTDKNGMLITN